MTGSPRTQPVKNRIEFVKKKKRREHLVYQALKGPALISLSTKTSASTCTSCQAPVAFANVLPLLAELEARLRQRRREPGDNPVADIHRSLHAWGEGSLTPISSLHKRDEVVMGRAHTRESLGRQDLTPRKAQHIPVVLPHKNVGFSAVDPAIHCNLRRPREHASSASHIHAHIKHTYWEKQTSHQNHHS